MDRSIEEIIVRWRKALAGGYHDSRLNASETSKLVSKMEQLKKALEDIKILVARRWVTNMPGRKILEIIDKELKGE